MANTDNLPVVSITLTTGDTFLTRYDERGRPGQSYPVKVGDVGAAFNVGGVSSGLLPPDVLFWQTVNGQCRIAIWIAPRVHALVFNKGRRGQRLIIPLPGFVFAGQGLRYWIWAAPMRPMHSDSLYVAPLSNVHPNGMICTGNVEFPVCAPETILNAASLFFESRFSNHLSERKVKAKGRETLEQKLASLHGGKAAFPDRWLLAGPTMKQVLEGIRDEYR